MSNDYLVIAVGPAACKSIGPDAEANWIPANELSVATVAETALLDLASHSHNTFTVGVMAESQRNKTPFRKQVSSRWRMKSFGGSSVGGAISACLGGHSIDAFAALVKPVEVAFMCAAARATGGELFLVPIRDLAATGTFSRSEAFVSTDTDVFVVGTGIGDSLVLEGVRHDSDSRITTQSICIRSQTRSTRLLTHYHDLGHKKFRVLSEDCVEREWLSYQDIRRRVERVIHHEPWSSVDPQKPR